MSEDKRKLAFGEDAGSSEFEVAEEDDYEFVLESIERRKSKKDTNYLNFKFRIRRDVQQRFQGVVVYYTISEIEGDDCFNFYRVNQLILTQKKDGQKLNVEFEEFDEVLQYLQGIHFKGHVTVDISPDGKERNEISGDSFEPSEWDKTHVAPVKHADGSVTSSNLPEPPADDDLPWLP